MYKGTATMTTSWMMHNCNHHINNHNFQHNHHHVNKYTPFHHHHDIFTHQNMFVNHNDNDEWAPTPHTVQLRTTKKGPGFKMRSQAQVCFFYMFFTYLFLLMFTYAIASRCVLMCWTTTTMQHIRVTKGAWDAFLSPWYIFFLIYI